METNEHIQHISTKLQQLLKQYEQLLKENSTHRETISRLQQEQQMTKEKLDTCVQQNLILKASVADMEPKEKKELEHKINQYMKSIDQCISLLSR